MSEKEKCCVHIAHDCHAGDGCRVVERMKAAHKPPQRTWVGLDLEEASAIWDRAEKRQAYQGVPALAALIQEVEAKLKEKNSA